LRSAEHGGWQERGLTERIQRLTNLPLTILAIDPACRVTERSSDAETRSHRDVVCSGPRPSLDRTLVAPTTSSSPRSASSCRTPAEDPLAYDALVPAVRAAPVPAVGTP
jgi:hypothetical protein